MTPTAARAVADRVGAAVEQVFGTVSVVREAALRELADGDAGHGGLAAVVADLLRTSGAPAVGMGLIEAPRPRLDLPLRLHWWQVDPQGGRLRELDPDLRPSSVGFYDYAAAPWFDVPRRTGRRYVVGPYVDVHGTGRYLLTLTEPVALDGEFAGVAGADVPVTAFEQRVLGDLGSGRPPFLLVNDEDRVVVSTVARRPVGSIVPSGAVVPDAGAEVPGVPWRVLVEA